VRPAGLCISHTEPGAKAVLKNEGVTNPTGERGKENDCEIIFCNTVLVRRRLSPIWKSNQGPVKCHARKKDPISRYFK